ncbi:MAG: bacteriocin transport accessory protein [Clostridia bacterium]|nr:bacteriocin transport accessory protein [Clostridia bacterium]
MKKIIAIMMSLVLVLSLAACGSTKDEETTADTTVGTEETTGSEVQAPATTDSPALNVLNTVWATYTEDEMFPGAGGDMSEENMNMEGPGIYGLSDTEALDATLGIPAASVEKIDGAASLVHMMNANTFTAGAYNLKNADDAEALAGELQSNIQARRWMCGFPEKLVIMNVDGVVISAFGNGEIIDNFVSKVNASFATAETLVDEPIR